MDPDLEPGLWTICSRRPRRLVRLRARRLLRRGESQSEYFATGAATQASDRTRPGAQRGRAWTGVGPCCQTVEGDARRPRRPCSDRQALAALGATRVDDGTAPPRLHAHEETVGASAADFGGLIRALHGASCWDDESEDTGGSASHASVARPDVKVSARQRARATMPTSRVRRCATTTLDCGAPGRTACFAPVAPGAESGTQSVAPAARGKLLIRAQRRLRDKHLPRIVARTATGLFGRRALDGAARTVDNRRLPIRREAPFGLPGTRFPQ